jgi:hypothetical protein
MVNEVLTDVANASDKTEQLLKEIDRVDDAIMAITVCLRQFQSLGMMISEEADGILAAIESILKDKG